MSNYANGAKLELAAKHYLEENGYFVVKSGGSKGVADLVALKPGQDAAISALGLEVLLVQCKNTVATEVRASAMAPADRMDLWTTAWKLRAHALICCWIKTGSTARRPGFAELYISYDGSPRLFPWDADHALENALENAHADH